MRALFGDGSGTVESVVGPVFELDGLRDLRAGAQRRSVAATDNDRAHDGPRVDGAGAPAPNERRPGDRRGTRAGPGGQSHEAARRRAVVHDCLGERVGGERRLTRLLATELADAVTLHDRKVPTTRGTLDHLVIAPSGIWLIDARRDTGEVECRSTGPFGSGEPRSFVDGRNQTRLVHAMGWQVAAVRAQLDMIGFGEVPVRPVICFTSSRWARRDFPFEACGVLVTWPAALVERIGTPGSLDVRLIDLVAGHLSSSLAAAGPPA